MRLTTKICIVLIAFIIVSTCDIIARQTKLELGIRYIKLGNTYRMDENYDKAEYYVLKGKTIVDGRSKYWNAAAFEMLGYIYLNKNMKKDALENLNRAYLLYKDVLRQKDGSHSPIESIMDRIQKDMGDNQNNSIEKPINIVNAPNNSNLSILNLDKNKLKSLPIDIPDNIENLSLADNKFNKFPIGLLNLKQLKYLNLENNKIKTIPNNLSLLSKLKYLNLSGNKLKKLPSGLSKMKHLEMLDLKDNKISFEEISNLIRALPTTNILFDEYILKPVTGFEDEDDFLFGD